MHEKECVEAVAVSVVAAVGKIRTTQHHTQKPQTL